MHVKAHFPNTGHIHYIDDMANRITMLSLHLGSHTYNIAFQNKFHSLLYELSWSDNQILLNRQTHRTENITTLEEIIITKSAKTATG